MTLVTNNRYEPLFFKDFKKAMTVAEAIFSEGDDHANHFVVLSREDDLYRIDWTLACDIGYNDKVLFMEEEDALGWFEKEMEKDGTID